MANTQHCLQNRLKSIATIHHKLYQNNNYSSLNLHDYLKDLYEQIASSLENKNKPVNVSISIPDTMVDSDTIVPLGLICNEIITNAYKYAFKNVANPELKIWLEKNEEAQLSLFIADNGPGLPVHIEFTSANTFTCCRMQKH